MPSMRPRVSRSASALSLGSLGAALFLTSLAPEARADIVHGTRSEKLVEQSHLIDIRIDRGSASLVVRRTFFNGGPRHDQAVVFLDVPGGGVATGLRTLGVKDDKPFWFNGELMEAEAAAAKYKELTGVGGYYPKDPVLLSWRSQSLLALQVFPVAPQQPKTVEYTFTMPTSYHDGKYHLVLPKMGTEERKATAVVSPARERDSIFVGDKRVEPGTSVVLDKEELDLALEPRRADTVDGGLSSIVFGQERSLFDLHIEAAPALSEAPRGAYVAVVMDASRSMNAPDREAQAAAAKAYLSRMPLAQVSLITFDREVHEVTPGRFIPARRAIDELNRPLTEPRNGSRLDDAIAVADERLARAPSKAAKRIVVMTDLLTRSAIGPDALKGMIKSGAIVHFGVVKDGRPDLARDDEGEWATVPEATGGLLWSARASASEGDTHEMTRVYEEWARPIKIDNLKVLVMGNAAVARQETDVLKEGEGITIDEIRKDAVTRVELKGELWSTPYSRAFKPSDAEARRSAALVFGSPLLSELKEPEMMGLAMLGKAVTPVTSYLAIEPGVRPSTEGLEESSGTGVGWGFGSGLGRLFGAGGRSRPPPIDKAEFLKRKLREALDSCGASAIGATVSLETTLSEIADVSIDSFGMKRGGTVDRCFLSAIWGVLLPDAFDARRELFQIKIEG